MLRGARFHELLLMAAGRTDGLLKEPSPFILQTSLDEKQQTIKLYQFLSSARSIKCSAYNVNRIFDGFADNTGSTLSG